MQRGQNHSVVVDPERPSSHAPVSPDDVIARLNQVRGTRSMAEFAESINVHRETVRRVFRIRQPPSFYILFSVCQVYDINANWLLFGIGPMFGRHQLDILREMIDSEAIAERVLDVISDLCGLPRARLGSNGMVNGTAPNSSKPISLDRRVG